MRRLLACVSLAALLGTGCGEITGGGSSEVASVDPKKVNVEELKAAVSDDRVKRFYEAGGWQAVWTDDLAGDLTAAFADAERHAINPESNLGTVRKGGTPAQREAALTLAALDYADGLARGIVDPRKLYEIYTVPMPKTDAAAGLRQAVGGGKVREWLASLAPSDPEYRALSDAYLQYKQRAPKEKRGPIAQGEAVEPGKKDPRLPQIAESLKLNGYLAATAPASETQASAAKKASPDPTRYGGEIVTAVKRLQSDYGIKPDGVIGSDTLEALNNGASGRARILAVNLERRRWLERQPPATRIDVNTAAAFLRYWRNGTAAHQAKVVVGQPGWETPELGSPIVRLVANPPWTVPDSIAEKEILPKGAAYMQRERISMKNGELVQESGPKSALGLVKFDMDNPHAIYLHDTPAKALFASEERHASHGCSRVENALNFARLLAQDDGQLEAFDTALSSGKERGVELSQKIPVRLLYHSAYLEGGRILFRPDPYGWDDKLAQALGLGGAVRARAKPVVTDIGP